MEDPEKERKAQNQEIVDSYRDLIASPAWNRFQDHLGKHLQQKQKVQAEAIRSLVRDSNVIHAVTLNQGYMDALNFVIGEPHKIITRLTNQAGDEGV